METFPHFGSWLHANSRRMVDPHSRCEPEQLASSIDRRTVWKSFRERLRDGFRRDGSWPILVTANLVHLGLSGKSHDPSCCLGHASRYDLYSHCQAA
jgi:hypothetical protein